MIFLASADKSLLVTGLEILFLLTVVVFIIYSLSLAYHWYSYGTNKATSSTALLVYLVVSFPLILTMAVTIFTLN